MTRLGLIVGTVLLSMLLAAPAADAFGPSPAADAAKAKGGKGKGGKGKKKKCRKAQVKVKMAGRTRCLPIGKALPKPKAGDQRAIVVKDALTPEIAKVPDPKNKLPPPMEQVYRKLGPKALKGMEQSVGVAVNRLEGLAAGKVGRTALANASAESGGSFSQQFGNVTVDARLSIATVGSELVGRVEFGVTTDRGDGTTVRVATEIPLRISEIGFRSPGCPTSEGKLDAKDGLGIKVRTEVRSNQGKTLEEFYSTEVVDETEMQGIVDDDAKLDKLEIRSIQEYNEHTGGSAFGSSSVSGSIVRNTVVDMKTGEYEPHVTLVNVGVKLRGIISLFAPFVQPLIAQRLKSAADKDFAAAVDFEMKKYRELEDKWNKPNTCAKLEFGKKNRSLTLHRNDSGDESVRVNATRGGSPASGKWSITGFENGSFSLNSDTANPNGFKYKALNAGTGIEVKGTFKVTSKAGVAEESWIQKTEQESTSKLSGNFSGENSIPSLNGPSVTSWNGGATLKRSSPDVIGGPNGSYELEAGSLTIHVSGQEGLGVTGCEWSGTEFVNLPAGPGYGSAGVFGTPPEYNAPYEYNIRIVTPFGTTMTFTRQNCPEGAEEEEGKEETIPFLVEFKTDEQSSEDGIHYAGSTEENQGGATFTQSWVFEAQP